MLEVETAAALADQAKTVISGAEFVDHIVSLVGRLKEGMAARGGKWRAVIGIARGGVFPAQRIAEALDIEYREIGISYYQGTVRGSEPIVLEALADERDGDGLLVVDDVVDSGGTALCVRRMLPRCDLAAIYTSRRDSARSSRNGVTRPIADGIWTTNGSSFLGISRIGTISPSN